MRDPVEALTRFAHRHHLGPWVVDDLGRHRLLADWAEAFIAEVLEDCAEADHDEAAQLRELREELDAKPRKTISTAKVREIIDP
ncbi:exonuclease V subunit gamma [Amycolatopsis cihanbeyliensis]|uniref:Uncharacterized protein n=1 Tax=Amycolatopsis cihanbeyliensis TaxID=1128664 RepID=A0A542DNK5_AMYCI|nr:exonuclease V subunit gamma [Amycolatopsis cihanbeyliensis]TQJ04670.1 hypothetical protein FB471_4475 [Amycolatopsis cihanbeyliensis]